MKRCGDSCCCTMCKPLHRPLSERDETRLIDQRDAAEAALSETYLIVTGRQPEWSNRFGYRDAVREIREECAWLIRPTDSAPPPAAESRAGEVERAAEELFIRFHDDDEDRWEDMGESIRQQYRDAALAVFRTAQEPAADSQITTSTGD